MNIKLRTAIPDDAQRCGTICYEAFTAIANQHNFPPDLPSAEVTIGLLSKLIADPRFYAIVAEIDHQVVGSNFMDERSAIAGLGPRVLQSAWARSQRRSARCYQGRNCDRRGA